MENIAKILRYVMTALMLQFGIASTCLGAEFTWFTDVQDRQGWIEFGAETVDFQNRIHVFPRIGGPGDPVGAPRVEGRSDGVVVTFEVDSNAPTNVNGFVKKVLDSIVTSSSRVSHKYQVNVPRPRALRIGILRDGDELAHKEINGRIPGKHTVQVKVPVSGDERQAMLRGEFQVQASFELPTANFSSLAINIKESLVSHYKIQALKSVVKRSRTSGGKFLIFDWRRRTARTIINQSIKENRSVRANRQTTVLTIDPDEQMLARVDKLLGIAPLSQEEFVSRHLKGAEIAKKAGNYELAKLHEEYAAKADDPTPRVQTEMLQKAFAALSGPQASIATFLANGIQFSESSNTSSSRFYGFGQTNSSYFGSKGYAEMNLTTTLVRYVINTGPFVSNDKALADFFGTATPNEEAATLGLLRATKENNTPMVHAALRFSAAFNAVYGLEKTTPLIIASKNCNVEIVRALLDAGANPFLPDGNSKKAKNYAQLAGCRNVSKLIESYE